MTLYMYDYNNGSNTFYLFEIEGNKNKFFCCLNFFDQEVFRKNLESQKFNIEKNQIVMMIMDRSDIIKAHHF